MWDVIMLIPDHCLSIYFKINKNGKALLFVTNVTICYTHHVLGS